MPAVDSLLRMAIQRYPCNSRDVVFAFRQSSDEGASMSTTAITVISVLAILVVAVIATLIIVYVIRRKHVATVARPDRQPMMQKVHIEEGGGMTRTSTQTGPLMMQGSTPRLPPLSPHDRGD
ncbi:uncharacterized protein LOC134245566 [Saccostrea cucullata]|uniref:uncharacterized protein LOC134245566 n=1 Tax=Saccostrea cuccullata TaxID=36930 RepID=UPI002ED34B0C